MAELQLAGTLFAACSAWRNFVVLWLALLAALSSPFAAAQIRGEEFNALEYREHAGGWVPNGPSPSAVCAAYAEVWHWNVNGYSYSLSQVSSGRWRCQQNYLGSPVPGMYTDIFGVCQTSAAAPILTGSYWSYPYWDETKGVCFCQEQTKYFDRAVQWCDYKPPVIFTPDRDQSCRVGNPVSPSSGIKQQTESDYRSPDGTELKRTYWYRSSSTPSEKPFGQSWQLQLGPTFEAAAGTSVGPVKIRSASGGVTVFTSPSSGTWLPTSGTKDQLIQLFDANGSAGWRYFDRTANTMAVFAADGKLKEYWTATGRKTLFTYSSATTPAGTAPWLGALIRAETTPGRVIDFVSGPAGVTQAVIPGSVKNAAIGSAQSPIRYAYDEAASFASGVTAKGQLTSVTYSDGSVRRYHYEDSRFPLALSGITDEAGNRFSDYFYDGSGRVSSERHRTGTGAFVNQYALSYTAAGQTQITGPLGSQYAHSSQNVAGVNLPTGNSQPGGSGCAASTSAATYDANGNAMSIDDFNGHRTCYAYDTTRNLEVTRVEGLALGAACGVTGTGSTLPSGSRKVSTQWHPDWSLATRVAEPGRITTYVYHGQQDPFTGSAANCVSTAGAALPGGKPLAVLCRQVEAATTDAAGALGFAAQLQSGVSAREQTWTYNGSGQILTHNGPLAGPADSTSYEYYTTTSFTGADPFAIGYALGDLKKTINAAGHVTNYTAYDKSGNWLQMVDANGVTTTRTFDARQRLTSETVAGQTTTYTYWPTGLLQQVTQPDGSWVTYSYDAAHRLTGLADNLGNSVTYTLDALGNRTAEQVKDPAGVLRLQLARSIDALGRVQQVTGRE